MSIHDFFSSVRNEFQCLCARYEWILKNGKLPSIELGDFSDLQMSSVLSKGQVMNPVDFCFEDFDQVCTPIHMI